jgi:hypothetical protein
MKDGKTGGRYAANVLVTLRVTPEEKKRLGEQAAVAGLFVSEYLRRRFFGGRPVIHRVDEWMIRELRRLGGLLKYNFETLRQAGAGPELLRRQEDLLEKIGVAIDALGKANDRQESQI